MIDSLIIVIAVRIVEVIVGRSAWLLTLRMLHHLWLSVPGLDLQKHLTADSILRLERSQVVKSRVAPPTNVLFIFFDVAVIDAETWLLLHHTFLILALVGVLDVSLREATSLYHIW